MDIVAAKIRFRVSEAKTFDAMLAVIVVKVLDALMTHLEETLEVVISRGENLVLDNKGVKKPKNLFSLVNWLYFGCYLANLGFLLSSGSSLFFSGSMSVSRAAVSSAFCGTEGWIFSALAATWEAAATLPLPSETAPWRAAAPELLPSYLHHPHHQCEDYKTETKRSKTGTPAGNFSSGCCPCRRCCQFRRKQLGHSAHSCGTTANKNSVGKWWNDWSKVGIEWPSKEEQPGWSQQKILGMV